MAENVPRVGEYVHSRYEVAWHSCSAKVDFATVYRTPPLNKVNIQLTMVAAFTHVASKWDITVSRADLVFSVVGSLSLLESVVLFLYVVLLNLMFRRRISSEIIGPSRVPFTFVLDGCV